ncbi:MAG: STAS domain-containing protein [Hyphomicrobiales bacterium]|nr:MAG: STAS domain-containing protein [Hyphomicrobiales bacterium]
MCMGLEILASETGSSALLRLDGRLDMETSASLASALAGAGARSVVLDMAECGYVSSAGLRVLLIAHRDLARTGHSLSLINVTPLVHAVFETTGLDQILRVGRAARSISLDGAELISSGACGDCYRLDRETVVKLYRAGVDPAIAEKEKRFAKAAFLLGVPTALSYDVVACGSRTGVVYEMIDATLFSAIIKADPANTPHHARRLAEIAKGVHAIKGDPAVFPRLKDQLADYIKRMDAFLDASDVAYLLQRLEAIPDSENCVHFDLHSSNVMIRQDEALIIDLGDFSRGGYLFDIGLICFIYAFPEFGVCELATKIPAGQGVQFYESFIEAYFSDLPASELSVFQRNRYFLASLRAIYTVTFLPQLQSKMVEIVRDGLLPKMRLES